MDYQRKGNIEAHGTGCDSKFSFFNESLSRVKCGQLSFHYFLANGFTLTVNKTPEL